VTGGGPGGWPIRIGRPPPDHPDNKPQTDVWQETLSATGPPCRPISALLPSCDVKRFTRYCSHPTGTIHCSAIERKKGRNLRLQPPPVGLAYKLPGPPGRLTYHRRRLLYRSGCGFRRGATGSGEENIKVRGGRAHHRPRTCATECHRREAGLDAFATHRPQLQPRHEEAAICGIWSTTFLPQKMALTPASRCGRDTKPASRIRL